MRSHLLLSDMLVGLDRGTFNFQQAKGFSVNASSGEGVSQVTLQNIFLEIGNTLNGGHDEEGTAGI
jgi:hypothetical protein